MRNYNQSVEVNHNPNWHYISDHLYKVLIIEGQDQGKPVVIELNETSMTRY